MKRRLLALSQQYQAALQKHLRQGSRSPAPPARRLGQRAVELGLETLDVARIHKTAMTDVIRPGGPPRTRERMVREAGKFFTEAITPIEETHRNGVASAARLGRKSKALARRTEQLAAVNRQLKQGVTQRKTAEAALRKGARHYAGLLEESRELQKHLQSLAHRILSAEENQRRKISHNLQDEIAQTLLGINVRLFTLRSGAAARSEALANEIAKTEQLVEKSIKSIKRFAREIRP